MKPPLLKTVKDFPKLAKRVSLKFLAKKLEKDFNEFIRIRDREKGCVSCGGPVDHAGHFYSISQAPQASMRFSEDNVHGQCVRCNSFQEGNRHGYREGLLKRYGPEFLQRLEIKKNSRQNPWRPFEYQTLIEHYRQKLKTLKN